MIRRTSLAARDGLGIRIAIGCALAALGCGGGAPMLHPARTLPVGDVRAAAGISAHVVPGSLGSDLRDARDIATRDTTGASSPGAPGTNPAYAKGALVSAAVAPGLAPFISARVGVGQGFEGGLTYTGRAIRADMRRSFDDGPWSFSIGLGGSAALYGRQEGTDLPNVDLSALHGYGADLPLLVGWQSLGGLYTLWAGPRAGFEHVVLEQLTSEPKSVTIGTPPIHLDATRWYAGGVAGVATGFRHVHVAVEVGVAYENVAGTYNATDVSVRGVTITPGSALWWTF
jgi:hypothetical protein